MSVAHCYSEKNGLMLVLERFTLIATGGYQPFGNRKSEKTFLTLASVNQHSSNKPRTKQ